MKTKYVQPKNIQSVEPCDSFKNRLIEGQLPDTIRDNQSFATVVTNDNGSYQTLNVLGSASSISREITQEQNKSQSVDARGDDGRKILKG